MLSNILAQRTIDTRLITLTGRGVFLEPGNYIGVDTERQLLLDRPIEKTPFRTGPVEKLGRVRGIDSMVREGSESFQLGQLLAL